MLQYGKEVKHRWLGHVLRMEQNRIPKEEGLKMESSRQKETWKAFEGDLKKMELTWGTAEREAKEIHSWGKRSSCIILNG